jgi:hypothetical protein
VFGEKRAPKHSLTLTHHYSSFALIRKNRYILKELQYLNCIANLYFCFLLVYCYFKLLREYFPKGAMSSELSSEPRVQCRRIPLPTDSENNWLHIVSDLLSGLECSHLIQNLSPRLEPQGASFTSRSRYIFKDNSLASTLWPRLQPFYGSVKFTDQCGYEWYPTHVNEHFRFCKYVAGDGFTPHHDGENLLEVDKQTMITVNIYLNTSSPGNGGATRVIMPIHSEEHDGSVDDLNESNLRSTERSKKQTETFRFKNKLYKVLYSVYPVQGLAAVFPAAGPLHDGAVLLSGEKFLLRTDIVFQRNPPFRLETEKLEGLDAGERRAVAEELGKQALDLATKLEDGGGDEAWEWYSRAFKLCPKLEYEVWR